MAPLSFKQYLTENEDLRVVAHRATITSKAGHEHYSAAAKEAEQYGNETKDPVPKQHYANAVKSFKNAAEAFRTGNHTEGWKHADEGSRHSAVGEWAAKDHHIQDIHKHLTDRGFRYKGVTGPRNTTHEYSRPSSVRKGEEDRVFADVDPIRSAYPGDAEPHPTRVTQISYDKYNDHKPGTSKDRGAQYIQRGFEHPSSYINIE